MNRWKRTLPAIGAILLLLFVLVPTAGPAFGAELQQGRLPLKYYWPTFIPRGLVIQPAESTASETLYMLRLQQPGGGQFDTTISGGAAGEPPGRSGQAVTVRDQRGMAYTTSAGYTVIWTEQEQVYSVSGGLGLQDTLAIANGLQEVDLVTFRRRLGGVTTRPSIYYTSAGRVFEIRPDGSTVRHGRLQNLGGVIYAVDYGLRTLVLSEKGLQSVVPREGAGVIARFTAGDADMGQLIATSDDPRVIYQYARADASAPTGATTVIGIFDSRTLAARKVYSAPGQVPGHLTALGLSRDGRGLYVLERGQNDAFVEIKLVSASNGSLIRRIPVAGYSFGLQSPDRRTFATMDEAGISLKLYDLALQANQSRVIIPGGRGIVIRHMIWSPDSRYIYVTLGSAAQPNDPHELWRVNVATTELRRVATGIADFGATLTIDNTGRWMLRREMQNALQVYDLTTGRRTRISILNDAVLFRWR